MSVDRLALSQAVLTVLQATGNLVDLAQRPAAAAGGAPHAILWPQASTTQVAMASGLNVEDTTVMQATCVARDRTIAMRIANDMTGAFEALPDTLADRHVSRVEIVVSRGPMRDPDDPDVWFCVVQAAVETWPT